MTDIVEELRNGAGYLCCTRAADEIERLQHEFDTSVVKFSREIDGLENEIERLRGLLAWHDSTVPEILADNERLREEIRILTLANKNLQAGLNVSDSEHG